jgi:hypothetical protein
VALAVAGGLLGAAATIAAVAKRPPEVTFEPRAALDMQKEFGWSFGATGEPLVFDGQSSQPFDRTALARMPTDFAPIDPRYAAFFVPTLFQASTAMPKTTLKEDAPFTPLSEALVPVFTPAMEIAFGRGAAFASLMDEHAKDLAVIVDLPGPIAVAFAAGAASVLEPIFTFDNWPHPRGVVPAHVTLAAAAYYQPLFARMRGSRAVDRARPMFVLDRQRLAPYTDDAAQFDNRHVARVPTARALGALGVKDVLYVTPTAIDKKELDDLVDDFLALSAAKMSMHVMPATAFGDAPPYPYGGQEATHRRFWHDWAQPESELTSNDVQPLVPTPRATSFSAGARPTGFGMVPVAVAAGVVLGARLSRSGSWNRGSGSTGS